MRRKKRHKSPPTSAPPQREEALHSPFRDLKARLQQVQPPPERPPPAAPVIPSVRPPAAPPAVSLQDKALFSTAMAEVTPLPKDPRGAVGPRRPEVPRTPGLTGDQAGMADLRALVEGRGAFTIQYTDEYMEGVAPGIDPRLAQRIHRGHYAVQAYIDLHGHTVEEAKPVVERFVTTAYASGQRCVLIIHGRGHNSKDNKPVLKEQVQFWLSHGRLSRMVLAFATAPTNDGGAGAVCVLLRRAPHLQKKL